MLTYTGDEPLTRGPVYSHVAGRDGLVAMTSDQGAETVRRALRDAPSSDSGRLAAELSGPGLAVVRVEDDCVRAMTMVDPFDGEDARLVLVAQAETSKVTFVGDRSSTLGRYLRFGTPEFADGRLRVPVQATQPTLGPLSLFTGDVAKGDLWECS